MKSAANTSHEFGFSFRSELIMQTAQGGFRRTERIVDLAEVTDQTMLLEFMLAECTSKEAAIIAFFFEVDQVCTREWCGGENHRRKKPTLWNLCSSLYATCLSRSRRLFKVRSLTN